MKPFEWDLKTIGATTLASKLEEPDKRKETALTFAAVNGYPKIVKQLLESGAHVDTFNDWGYTALMKAAGKGHLSIVRMLLQAGADLQLKSSLNKTPLMYAAMSGRLRVVWELIKEGSEVNMTDSSGYSSLTHAVRHGREHVTRYLLKQNADINFLFVDEFEKLMEENPFLKGLIEANLHRLTPNSLKKWKANRLHALYR